MSIVNAFLFIGLDLSLRDKLHEKWHGKKLFLKMLGLLITGGIITFILNRNAGRIAIASVIAFCMSGAADAIMYEICFKQKKLIKMNVSNGVGAFVDSIAFPGFLSKNIF